MSKEGKTITFSCPVFCISWPLRGIYDANVNMPEVFIRDIELFRVRVPERVMIETVTIIIRCIEVVECLLLLPLL